MAAPHASQAEPGAAHRTLRFEQEALPHLDGLFRIALRMVGERSRAEDIVQDVYLRAWQAFDRFEPGTNCRAWLFQILFYCVQHQRRKWWNLRLVRDGGETIEAMPAAGTIPEKLSDGDIIGALDALPADFRAVALLVDVEELAYKEVAEILKIPIGTVMSRLSRARRLLRERLAETARGYGIGLAEKKEARS
jgi:RNA polymerase sigma-70 factor, ECF subfamily